MITVALLLVQSCILNSSPTHCVYFFKEVSSDASFWSKLYKPRVNKETKRNSRIHLFFFYSLFWFILLGRCVRHLVISTGVLGSFLSNSESKKPTAKIFTPGDLLLFNTLNLNSPFLKIATHSIQSLNYIQGVNRRSSDFKKKNPQKLLLPETRPPRTKLSKNHNIVYWPLTELALKIWVYCGH